VRSRAAASTLLRAGFDKVYSMEGGIMAWQGFVAKGVPEPAMAYFEPATTPEEMLALAWYLENGSQRFYGTLATQTKESDAAGAYHDLARAEERHQATLLSLYLQVSGASPEASLDASFPGSIISTGHDDDVMEGGMRVSEALDWAKDKKPAEVFELSIALEANSLDLYLVMEKRMRGQEAGRVFKVLAGEEKAHLERLSALLEKST
jgi:sulfur-carrier protein adenylyltransferase/sulfurtransferase